MGRGAVTVAYLGRPTATGASPALASSVVSLAAAETVDTQVTPGVTALLAAVKKATVLLQRFALGAAAAVDLDSPTVATVAPVHAPARPWGPPVVWAAMTALTEAGPAPFVG